MKKTACPTMAHCDQMLAQSIQCFCEIACLAVSDRPGAFPDPFLIHDSRIETNLDVIADEVETRSSSSDLSQPHEHEG